MAPCEGSLSWPWQAGGAACMHGTVFAAAKVKGPRSPNSPDHLAAATAGRCKCRRVICAAALHEPTPPLPAAGTGRSPSRCGCCWLSPTSIGRTRGEAPLTGVSVTFSSVYVEAWQQLSASAPAFTPPSCAQSGLHHLFLTCTQAQRHDRAAPELSHQHPRWAPRYPLQHGAARSRRRRLGLGGHCRSSWDRPNLMRACDRALSY